MRTIYVLIFSLGWMACQNSTKSSSNLYQGQARHLQWLVKGKDTLLYVYSVSTYTRRGYSSTGSSANVSSQEGQHLVFRLRDSSLSLVAQEKTACAKPQVCGNRDFDRVLAYGQDKVLLYCECEKQWSLWSCVEHKELFNSQNAPFLSQGQELVETRALVSPPDVVKFSLSDGQVLYYSLDEGLLAQVPKGSGYCGDGQKVSSLSYQNRRLSFEQVGQGQGYRLGLVPDKTWLEAGFLRAANACQAWQSAQGFWILHRKVLDVKTNLPDQMSFVNWKGEVKASIGLEKFYQSKGIEPSFWAAPPYLYIAYGAGLAIYDQERGVWLREE